MKRTYGPRRAQSVAAALYVIWGIIGFSILLEFGLLLHLQRRGSVIISEAGGGPLSPTAYTALAGAMFVAAATLVLALRSRARDPDRLARDARRPPGSPGGGDAADRVDRLPAHAPAAGRSELFRADAVVASFARVSVAAWAVAEGLALAGFALALALQPAPRLAMTICFTGALFLWLLARPALGALGEALRRLGVPA